MKTKKVKWHSEKVNIPGVSFDRYESETAFQIYCADWLRKQYELTGNDGFKWWHHSANERSSGSEGFTAKMMGQSKGFPDFINCGLQIAIELKTMNGVLSEHQKKWNEYFSRIGWTAQTVYTFAKFKELVLEVTSLQK